jgi:hypothetical protein
MRPFYDKSLLSAPTCIAALDFLHESALSLSYCLSIAALSLFSPLPLPSEVSIVDDGSDGSDGSS